MRDRLESQWCASAAPTTLRRTACYASFDLSRPEGGPFPSDIFTVEDASHNTGLRVNYPLPDCSVRPTDCDDLAMVNTLDGWALQPRISIPFTGDVDPTTLNSNAVFLLDLSDGARIGINQLDLGSGDAHAPCRVGQGARPASPVCGDRHRRRTRHLGQGGESDERLRVHGRAQRARVVPGSPQGGLRCRANARAPEERHHFRERLHDPERDVRDGANSRLDQGDARRRRQTSCWALPASAPCSRAFRFRARRGFDRRSQTHPTSRHKC